MDKEKERVVILGGGIVGASIAYFMTLKGAKNVTVLERSKIAASAGGKGGGFLAGGWGDGSVTQELHRRSFQLHEELAETLGIESYRKIQTLSVSPSGGSNVASWLDGTASSRLMDPSTAQMMQAAQDQGATVQIGTAAGLEWKGDSDQVAGVRLESGEVLDCDQVVVAMGIWSVLLEDWVQMPVPMEGVKSTSLVYQNVEEATAEPYALFCGENYKYSTHLEVYPRASGEIYICGCGGSDYVSGARLRKGGDCEMPEQISSDPKRVQAASQAFRCICDAVIQSGDSCGRVIQSVDSCGRVLQSGDSCGRVLQSGDSCGRVVQSGDSCGRSGDSCGRVIQSGDSCGRVIQSGDSCGRGVHIAAGHNCWGILWAPITGLAMAELILDGKSSVDLRAFSPARYMKRKGARGRSNVNQSVGEQW
eukprot:gene12103-14302_t